MSLDVLLIKVIYEKDARLLRYNTIKMPFLGPRKK